MPELPEVETIVRDLRPHLAGRRLEAVRWLNPLVLRHPGPEAFTTALQGSTVRRVSRRGKFIRLSLGSGRELVLHLGMSGTLTLDRAGAPVLPHTHLRLELEGGPELRYRDPRRFGRVLLGGCSELRARGLLPELGPEPLAPGFSAAVPWVVCRGSRRPLKALLLDQGVVAGCGNIYADEACFLARVRPTRRGEQVRAREWERLLRALTVVMREAIRRRGTSFSDYRDGFGARGEAYESLMVYGRGGQPCVRCGSRLREARCGGRATVYCARCQR